jgi:hypothetical protein
VILDEISEWTCRVEKFGFYAVSDTAIWILTACHAVLGAEGAVYPAARVTGVTSLG